jgi:hypothetical protein
MLLERIITASNLIAFGSCDPAIVTPDYGFNFGFEDRSAILVEWRFVFILFRHVRCLCV